MNVAVMLLLILEMKNEWLDAEQSEIQSHCDKQKNTKQNKKKMRNLFVEKFDFG